MKIREILLSDIFQGEQLIREEPDDDSIGELAESLASNGLMQPIGVELREAGGYQLLWGDRRRRAALRLNWTKITARVYDRGEAPIKAVALIENAQRRQMTLPEEVSAVRFLAEEKDLNVERIASTLNKSRSWVLSRLMADHLPAHIREPLMEGALPITHAEMIANFPDDSMQRYFVAQVIQQRWTKSQLRQMIEAASVPGVVGIPTATNIPGVNPMPPNAPLLYHVVCCDKQVTIENCTLVRVCADGTGCRTAPTRPGEESSGIPRMEDSSHRGESERSQDNGRQDHPADPELIPDDLAAIAPA